MAEAQSVAYGAPAAGTAATAYRRSCTPLFFATAIYHVHRQVLGALAHRAFGGTGIQCSNIITVLWARLIGYPRAWAVRLGKFLPEPPWRLLISWLPKFLSDRQGLSVTRLGRPPLIVCTRAPLGSLAGGWIPARLAPHSSSANRALKTAARICALAVPIVFAAKASDLRVAGARIGLTAAAHRGWSATSDLPAAACVVGIGGFDGAVGGMFISAFAGLVLQITDRDAPGFIVAGSVYRAPLLVTRILAPRLQPAAIEQ